MFAELLALANCLPGPTAGQVLLTGVIVSSGSLMAGVLAYLCFMGPAAIAMAVLGCWVPGGAHADGGLLGQPWVSFSRPNMGDTSTRSKTASVDST